MRKLRLFFAAAALTLALGACSSSTGLDCDPTDGFCQQHTVGSGSHTVGSGS